MLATLFQIISPSHCIKCNAYGVLLCSDCVAGKSLVAPSCYRCNRLTEDSKTCRSCRSSSNIFALQKTSYYEGAVKELLVRAKFGPDRRAARELGDRVALIVEGRNVDRVTYVPTDAMRRRQRGFDHARLMAERVAQQHALPCSSILLRKKGVRQTGADRLARRRQMEHAFSVLGGVSIRDEHVLIIDDVVSTGASIEAAATLLKQRGARRVSAAVAAHNR